MFGMKIGIDLGTTSVQIYVEGKGIVLSEPSVAACNAVDNSLICVGERAYEMVGKNPDSIRVVKPMRNGVISDFGVTRRILEYYVERICRHAIFKPRVIVCMPSTITNLERHTLLDAAIAAGAGRAGLIEEPLAAAIGAGLDISHPYGTIVVDIGGGTTDIAVITMGSIAISSSIKVAGNTFDDAIIRYVRYRKGVLIGELTAEQIKKSIGCAYLREEEVAMTVKGKDYASGMPCSFEITSSEVYSALRESLDRICSLLTSVLEFTPPELASDIATEGIILTGGGALLYGMDRLIYNRTGLHTQVADDAVNCVAKGIGKVLGGMQLLEDEGYIFKTRASDSVF